MEKRLHKSPKTTWKRYLERHTSFTWFQINEINATLIALWLIKQKRSKAASTLAAKLDDIATILRELPAGLIHQMSEPVILTMFRTFSIARRSLARRRSSLKSLFQFLQKELEIQTTTIAWWNLRTAELPIQEIPLMTQPNFENILAYALAIPKWGRTLAAALLIAYYWGLRDSEACDLHVGDMLLDGTPTIFVWKGKGGYSRPVEGVQIPPPVIKFLHDYHNDRLQIENNRYSAHLLQTDNGQRLSPGKFLELFSSALSDLNLINLPGKTFACAPFASHVCK